MLRPVAALTLTLAWLAVTATISPARMAPKERIVAVDAGHGPKRPGATSATGVDEYVFNLNLARQVVESLHKAGFGRAFLIDPQGLDLAPAERAKRANAAKADLLVSIHHDAAQPQFLETWTVNGKTRRHTERFAGYSLFYSGRSVKAAASLELAGRIGRELKQAGLIFTRHHAADIPGERRELVDDTVGVYRYDGLAVLARADMPAVLLEAGVIVNRDEEAALATPARQHETAEAVARGVAAYFADTRTAPRSTP